MNSNAIIGVVVVGCGIALLKNKNENNSAYTKNINVKEYLYSNEGNSRHTNSYNKINITFIKNLIGKSLSCDDIPNLEEGLRLLNEYISGYKLLSDKFNKTRILNIYNHLCKLKLLRSKVHYELGSRYDNNCNTDKANENYLLAINFADENEPIGDKIIKKSFTRLVNNGFIIN